MSQRSVMSLAVACMLAVALSVCIEPVCEGSFGDGYSGTNIVTMGGGGFDYVVPAGESADLPNPCTNAHLRYDLGSSGLLANIAEWAEWADYDASDPGGGASPTETTIGGVDCRSFDGGDYLKITNNTTIGNGSQTNTMYFSVWITTLGGSDSIAFSLRGANIHWAKLSGGDATKLESRLNGGDALNTPTGTMVTGVWKRVVLVIETNPSGPEAQYTYMNGELVTNSAPTGLSALSVNDYWYIGSDEEGADKFLIGALGQECGMDFTNGWTQEDVGNDWTNNKTELGY